MAFLLAVSDIDAPRVRPSLATVFGKHGHDELRRRAPGGLAVRIATRGTRVIVVADDESAPPILEDLASELSKAGAKVHAVGVELPPGSKSEVKATRQVWEKGRPSEDRGTQAQAEGLVATWRADGTMREGSEAAVDLALALVEETRSSSERWTQVMFRRRPAARHVIFVKAIEDGEEVTIVDLDGHRAVRRKGAGGSTHMAVLDDEGLALVEAALRKKTASAP